MKASNMKIAGKICLAELMNTCFRKWQGCQCNAVEN
jgi:hypothetical protein